MELAPVGRLLGSLGTGMLAIGLFFSNSLIYMFAVAILAYLLFEGLAFRHAVDTFKHSVEIEMQPRIIRTLVGNRTRIETIIQNKSILNFRIVELNHTLSPEIHEERHFSTLSLSPEREQRFESFLEVKSPGRYRMSKSVAVLEGGFKLFRESVQFVNEMTMTAWPTIKDAKTFLRADAPYDLTVDTVHREFGTDLAELRPWNFLDDLHRIEWKATARTGKLMTREFYLERDPTIVLLIDASSSMRAQRGKGSLLNSLVEEVQNFLEAIRLVSSPVGLILYDEETVIANIEPGLGFENRERILRALLQNTGNEPVLSTLSRSTIRSLAVLTEDTQSLERELSFREKTKPYHDRSVSFAGRILPFYRMAMSNRLRKLRRQGVFRAFELIGDLSEPVLVVAISNGKTNLDGLYEGAKRSAILKHRVIIAILLSSNEPSSVESFFTLEQARIRTLRCTPDQLWRITSSEIATMGRDRHVPR